MGGNETNSDAQPRHLDPGERLSWLRLWRSEGIGPRTFRILLKTYGSAEAALEAAPDLAGRGALSGRRNGRRFVLFPEDDAAHELEGGISLGAELIAAGEPGYPPLLEHIHDPPPLIWLKGRKEAVEKPPIAIVGSRNASAFGRKLTREMAAQLSAEGYLIVSGLARGIDAAAHEGSLEHGTLAVLAGGLGRIYPPEHAPLLEQLTETGAAVTEMPPDWTARAQDFPRRNRIVSGSSYGVIVIEAARRSGSLITARLAGEQGREVFAVPGFPLDPRSEGTNGLIRNGAVLTRDAADILEVLRPMTGGVSPIGMDNGFSSDEPALDFHAQPDSEARTRVLDLLSTAPLAIDDLVREAKLPAATVQWILVELEMAKVISRNARGDVALAAGI